ncbi:MAG: nickel pincer cofactor biosynthesis protein LarB [Candidatus Altiarchaeota archaeon]|nr:nickel pincer cofactor biosynthesis protein LarB [Candidatus Altiarchaeota archaeon]
MKDFIKPDLARAGRCGIPEIVYGAGKSPGELIDISRAFLKDQGRVIITRLDESRVEKLKASFGSVDDVVLEHNNKARTLVLKNKDFESVGYGTVGLITAGTSDIPVAEEARVVLKELGCETRVEYDVGIAGIHRVFDALKSLSGVDLFIVVAGMEGALPSVVAGLVDKPVIAVPSSVGYGTGEKGFAALNTMLNSCTPLAVVNVDNGFGAASIALKILRLCDSLKND